MKTGQNYEILQACKFFFWKAIYKPQKMENSRRGFVKKANKIIVVTDKAKEELLSRVNIDQKIIVYPNTVRMIFIKQKVDRNLEKNIQKNL